MTDDQPEPKIEIELPGEDPEPPEYEQMVDFGERIREVLGGYTWNCSTLVGSDGDPTPIPTLHACIESAFRIQVAASFEDATFPRHVRDAPDVDADFVVTDQDLGQEDVAVTVSATDADARRDRSTERSPDGMDHWEVVLRYRLPADGSATADAVSSSSVSIRKQ